MSFSKLLLCVYSVGLVLCLLAASTEGAPFFDALFSAFGGDRRSYHPAPRNSQGRSYKEICKVHNVDAYAFPGRVPYPAGPLCPY